jgi:hypothetical protein
MDWSVAHKMLRFDPYNILWVTSQSINCHMALLSTMNYLLNIETTYINIGCKLHALAQAFDIYFAKQYFP